jgi:hypothetical protein
MCVVLYENSPEESRWQSSGKSDKMVTESDEELKKTRKSQ